MYIRNDFIVEMQIQDRIIWSAGPVFYQEQMGAEILEVGDEYEKPADSPTYGIVFCRFNYYNKGYARYQFENREVYHPELRAGAGRTIILFNATATNFENAEEFKPFLE